jgi:hypothetical protein
MKISWTPVSTGVTTFYKTINFHQGILEKAEKIFSFPSSLLSGRKERARGNQ